MPQHYFIDPGNVCSLRCPFCPTGRRDAGVSRGFMSRKDFEVIFRKIVPYAKMICLYNWGEPFLNKDLLYMVLKCTDHGIFTHIDSNLASHDFSDSFAEDIVRSGVSSIFASIDGVTQEAYEKYRVGGSLRRVLANLRKLVAAKERLGMDTPMLGWAFYIHKFNEHEIEKAKEVAKEIGVDIWFKLLIPTDASWCSIYHYQQGGILRTPHWVGKAYPVPVDPRLFGLSFHPKVPEICKQPFSTMLIDWNGEVTPCCSMSGEQYSVGNLLREDLDAVWNGARLRKCREFLCRYGPVQNTGSVCETQVCPLSQKHDP